MAGKVTVTRGELARLRALITEAIGMLDEILARPDTRPVEHDEGGWPILPGSGVIDLP